MVHVAGAVVRRFRRSGAGLEDAGGADGEEASDPNHCADKGCHAVGCKNICKGKLHRGSSSSQRRQSASLMVSPNLDIHIASG